MEKLEDASRKITVAVKYCGGCNPYYDAAKAVEAVEGMSGTRFYVCGSENPPDICLLVKQCRSDCFARPEQWSRFRTVLLESADAAEDAALKIRSAIKEIIFSNKRSDPL